MDFIDTLKLQKEGAAIPEQVAIFHEAFDSLTNGNTNLPEILVFNADNSDSMGFSEVNQALLQFKTEVEQIYTDKGKKVLIPSHTSSNFMGELSTGGEHIPKKQNGYLEGIRINEGEDYIRQSQMSLKDAIDEYNKGDGQPLESDPNRQITGLRQFRDGNLDGQMTEWYTNGEKRLEYTWKDGKRDGLMLEYNPDGTEKFRATYKDGEQVFD